MGTTDHRIPHTNFSITIPVRAGQDGEIIDARGKCVAVVDHNRELSDVVVGNVVDWLVAAVNAGAQR